ncbi:ATP-binding protein [Oxalobacteraceae bacterium A2-2]
MTQPLSPQLQAGCDQEPIRYPGSIQPHGFLLALDQHAQVLQASDNLASHAGLAPEQALGRPLEQVLGEAAAPLARAMAGHRWRERPSHLATVRLGGTEYEVLAHAYDGLRVLEFEPAAPDAEGAALLHGLYPVVGDFLSKVSDADTVEELCQLAADDIRALTGYGRVLVYCFDREDHGQVLAESLQDGYPSYLGQRFPAGDIPRQARELYLLNRIRLIQDANYTPSALVPGHNPLSGQPNDLSHAILRSVSPVHLQYMRNMGTLSSMSVSLVIKGRLWGMISCHHAQPRHIGCQQRAVCEQLGQILALRIQNREDADELQFRLEVRRVMVAMLAGLTQGSDFIENLRSVLPELLQFGRAGGVAIVVQDRTFSFGDTPDDGQVRELVAWLGASGHGDLFHTEHLASQFPPAAAYARQASGLLAMPISSIHPHYLLWFRPEIVSTIDWAGRPDQKSAEHRHLSPRTSFQSWRQTIHGHSAPWREGELQLALEFRTALLGIALERAEQMADLAEGLGRANKELEAFSYSVSHDLRAPLRHIVGFSDLLLETGGSEDTARRMRFLTNIKDAARLAGKLVDDLLSFSQMGRASLRPVRFSMNEMVRTCVERLGLEVGQRRIDWRIGDLPEITGDPNFLQLAVYNLLSNAVKFSAQRDPAVIRVSAKRGEGETVFEVADNGVGFNMDYVHKLFGVFQRLHRMEDFHGTGIGLANVRRIVERHGGRVWAHSAPNEGATFHFAIPDHIATD